MAALAAALAVALSTPFHARADDNAAPTPPPHTAPVNDLSQFKTADALFAYVHGINGNATDTDAEFAANLQATRLATADFLTRFPKDPHAWEVKLIDAQTAVEATGRGIQGYDLAKAQATLKQIAATPDADAKTKYTANVELARVDLRTVPDDKVEPWLVAWLADHHDGWQDETLGIMLSDHLRNMDNAKRVALLTTLRDSKNEDIYGNGEDLLWANNRKQHEPEMKGLKLLDLKFTAVDGTPVDISKMRGKVVLVDFWAVWCHSCMEGMPETIAAYKKYHDKGFEIIGISLDDKKDLMLNTIKAKEMTWPEYYDGKNFENVISTSFGINAIPQLWLVNKKGMIVDPNATGHLDEAVAKLLAEPE